MKTTIFLMLCMAITLFGISGQLSVLGHSDLAHWIFTAAIFMVGGACSLAFVLISEKK